MIFLDLGAWTGDSTRRFQQFHKIDHAYLFEPIRTPYVNCPHTIIKAAVWDTNEENPFYLDRLHGLGSSLLKKKTTGNLDRDRPVTVSCIDFSDWLLKQNFAVYEKDIVAKVNIEGAEYRVLEKLFRNQFINFVDTWYIAFHAEKMGLSADANEQIRREFRLFGYKPCTSEVFPELEGWS